MLATELVVGMDMGNFITGQWCGVMEPWPWPANEADRFGRIAPMLAWHPNGYGTFSILDESTDGFETWTANTADPSTVRPGVPHKPGRPWTPEDQAAWERELEARYP